MSLSHILCIIFGLCLAMWITMITNPSSAACWTWRQFVVLDLQGQVSLKLGSENCYEPGEEPRGVFNMMQIFVVFYFSAFYLRQKKMKMITLSGL